MISKHLSIGILAHVDAGKTTLSEALLYLCGAIRKAGRVDHKDAFLDSNLLERERGITIFSKQAKLRIGDFDITLLDTPGHSDFSPEMERTLQVLDYAILVINGMDGVTGQTQILWRLLKNYKIPCFIFVNKMDQAGVDKESLMEELKKRLESNITDLSQGLYHEEVAEELAMCDEKLLNAYLEGNPPSLSQIRELLLKRQFFPCLFGSALKMEGIEEFIAALKELLEEKSYPDEAGAKVFKISRDPSGIRLSFVKVSGGSLKVRSEISYKKDEELYNEKIDQIRVYSGDKYEAVSEAMAGEVVALTGLSHTASGQGLLKDTSKGLELMQPILSCSVILPEGSDKGKAFKDLKLLEEEEPMLKVSSDEKSGDINIRVMGRVQEEVLKRIIKDRFGIDAGLSPGRILYKESIKNTVEGVGHFEPLRHYAEVHLKLEPGEPGSGVTILSNCPVDILDKNWQRLILTHIGEKKHAGVLTGSEITDIKISLIAGRAHEKHTEGGDFRQATYRAIRQGLMQAESLLLEPVYKFRIELPSGHLGRAISDINKMYGDSTVTENKEGRAVLEGKVPASEFGDYGRELSAYTSGSGIISLSLAGYEPCHDPERVIEEYAYDPEADVANPSSSVFCSHGSGFIVPWDMVREYMHVNTDFEARYGDTVDTDLSEYELKAFKASEIRAKEEPKARDYKAEENELKAIFEKTYGPVKERDYNDDPTKYVKKVNTEPVYKGSNKYSGDEYLLVDGYNIIHASKELGELAGRDLKAARDRLMDILVDFQGYRKEIVILIFDAYMVSGGKERVFNYQNIDVVFTREAETADQYIERTTHEKSKKNKVTVASSDLVEQVIIMGAGAIRMSAADFWNEIKLTRERVNEHIRASSSSGKRIGNTIGENMPTLPPL
ncbi:MAG: TetM/TetW/TetO/TetS family tetracycline resistance ribosomal protection protein [Lachnospiraceae bacterium]|nr:TetM/TetW/TetO/TetS family tetracycline resistance ribosomal protection protein [Lachnospiraceae bacterium]